MTRSDNALSKSVIRRSSLWEIYIPFTAATVPAAIFALLGLVNRGLARPGAEASLGVVIAMVALQLCGIVAMAIVILMRFEFASQQLLQSTHGSPPGWRKLLLVLSILFLLLFDVLTNVAAAFAGAGFLLVLAVPVFGAYVACGRLALMRLGRHVEKLPRVENAGGG